MPMSHAARMQVAQAATRSQVDRPQSKIVRPTGKNQVQTTSILLQIGAKVMCKTPPSKVWYPGVVTYILCTVGHTS